MAEFDALDKLLSSTQEEDSPSKESAPDDDMDAEDSGPEVFNSAAQEAFHALKADDQKGFVEALRTLLDVR